MRHPPGSAMAWLAHPATVTATFLLLVNDHLLKAVWPGLITGKLSDFAGLMVAPPLLALARVPAPAALAATGLGFILVKTTQTGADLASQAWTLLAGPSLVLADPTDLIALPALAAAWAVHQRSRTEHAVRQARTLVIVPVALIAVTATSVIGPFPATTSVSVDDDTITVHGESVSVLGFSRDGGRTWSAPAEPSPYPSSTPGPASAPWPPARTRACLPGDPTHCYRVVPPRLAVDESRDGGRTWTTAWEVSPGREDMLRRRYGGSWPVFWKGSQAVAVQEAAGGHAVVAALGSEGIAVRDADGTWRRMGFSSEGFSVEDATPLSSPEIDLAPERFWGFFAGLFTFMAGIVAARHRRRPSGRVLAATAYTLVVIGVVLAALDGRDTLLPNLMFLTGSICALLGALLALVAAVRARLGSRSWLCLLAVPPVTTLTIRGVFSGWAHGFPDHYVTAVVLSCLVAVAGAAASAVAGWKGVKAQTGSAGEPSARTMPEEAPGGPEEAPDGSGPEEEVEEAASGEPGAGQDEVRKAGD